MVFSAAKPTFPQAINQIDYKTVSDQKQLNIEPNPIDAQIMIANVQIDKWNTTANRPAVHGVNSSAQLAVNIETENLLTQRAISSALLEEIDKLEVQKSSPKKLVNKNKILPMTITTTHLQFSAKKEKLFCSLPSHLVNFHLFCYLNIKELTLLTQVNSVLVTLANHQGTSLTKYKLQKWNQAIESQSHEKILKLLTYGIAPIDLKSPIIINTVNNGIVAKSIFDILFESNDGEHNTYYYIADQLLNKGGILPSPCSSRQKFISLSSYFSHLGNCDRDLYITLRTTPDIIHEQDVNGRTLLHHCATLGIINGSNHTNLILEILFTMKDLNFTIQDNNGNTPLHLCALH